MENKRNHKFIWAWGRLSAVDVPVRQITPKLIESVQASSIQSVDCGTNFAALTTHHGELYSWGVGFFGRNKDVNLEKHDDHSLAMLCSKMMRSIAVKDRRYRLRSYKQVFLGEEAMKWLLEEQCVESHQEAVTVGTHMIKAGYIEHVLGRENFGSDGQFLRFCSKSPEKQQVPLNHNFSKVNNMTVNLSYVSSSRDQVFVVEADAGRTLAWDRNARDQGVSGVDGQSCGAQEEDTSAAVAHASGRTVPVPRVVEGLAGHVVHRIACGSGHSVALTSSGHVFTWGRGSHGRLGHGNCDSLSVPTRVEELAGQVVSAVACGWSHTLVVADSDKVFSWGCNVNGRLGLGDILDRCAPSLVGFTELTEQPVVRIACGYHHSLAVDAVGTVFAWGGNDLGQLGVGDNSSQLNPVPVRRLTEQSLHVVGVAAGAFHSAVVTAVGEVFTWGDNQHGQLGDGFTGQRCFPCHVEALSGMDASLVACGGDYTVAVTDHFAVLQNDYFVAEEQDSPPALNLYQINQARIASVYNEKTPTHSPVALPTAAPVAIRNTTPIPILTPTPSSTCQSDIDVPADPPASHIPRSIQSAVSSWFHMSASSSSPSSTPQFLSPHQYLVGDEFRPEGLPPKNKSELSRQRREVSRLTTLYQRKLEKKAKEKARKRQRDLARRELEEKKRTAENKKMRHREQRMEQATHIWLTRILPKWEHKRDTAQVRDLVFRIGIPPKLRGKVWPMAIGNNLMITQDLYHVFATRAKAAEKEAEHVDLLAENVEEDIDPLNPKPRANSSNILIIGKENTIQYIGVDLHRTFPTLAFFQEDGPMNVQLKNVLQTYCFYRPDVGYVQGMSYLAGHLLLYMEGFSAFRCFANLLNSPFFLSFLKLNVEQMNTRYSIFNSLFSTYVPELFAHFEEIGVAPNLYFMEWSMTLFSKRLNLDLASRVWDCILLFGEEFVYRAAVAILKVIAPRMLAMELDEIMRGIRVLPGEITEDELFDTIGSIRMSPSLCDTIATLNNLDHI